MLGGALSAIIAAQLCFGIYFTIGAARNPRELLSRSVCSYVGSSRPLVQPLPEINLDAFNFCAYKRWRFAELFAAGIVISFGTPSLHYLQRNFTSGILMHFILLPHCDTVDISAFLIILVTAKRQGRNRHPGISSILDTVLREATLYFLLMFASQFLFVMFLFFAPVSDI